MKGSADLVAYFYLKTFSLLNAHGTQSLIACNTISQGETRAVGLEQIVLAQATIINAKPNMPWPGTAGVAISPVSIFKGTWNGSLELNGEKVDVISTFLADAQEWAPKKLSANANQSYIGSYVLGLGFTMSEDEARRYISKNVKNSDVLFPYLSGDDLNSSPTQAPSRWTINFFDWSLERAASYKELFTIVEQKVKPQRDLVKRQCYRDSWWHFAEKHPALYHAIGKGGYFEHHPEGWGGDAEIDKCIGTTLTSKHRFFDYISPAQVIDQTIVVIACAKNFACLSSSIHLVWSFKQGCSLETRPRYTPSTCYETFPFPLSVNKATEALGTEYSEIRKKIMADKKIGFTQLYNRFHQPSYVSPEIIEMRDYQKKIDVAIRDAYGWQDIDLDHGFHEVGYLPANDNVRYTISEPARIEILKRLSALNRQRWEEEEAAGLHKKGKK